MNGTEDYLTPTDRQVWTDDDFRILFAFIRDVRAVMREPNAPEYAPVILDDCTRASNALLYILRGTGANV
jgi:hypothetical protein